MTETTATPKKPSGKTSLVLRILLIVALLLIVLGAVQWRMLAGDLKRGVALYEEAKYQEAVDALQPLLGKTLAGFRIRGQAIRTIGLCKAEIASDMALKERSPEGYAQALKLLEEAKALAGPTPEIERRIKEYTEYVQKAAKAAAAEKAASRAAPAAPAPAPPPAEPAK